MFTVYGLAEGVLGVTFPPLERGPVIDCVDRAALMRDGFAKPARAGDANALRCRVVRRAAAGTRGARRRWRSARAWPNARRAGSSSAGRRRPAATTRTLSANADLFAGDWLNTGDLGYFAAGELYLTGREKDLIVRRGVNIHPAELEAAVANLPGVRKGGVAVFPAADARTGSERLVVLAETRETDAGERKRIVAAITRLAVDRIGMPPDDVVLAPPRSVLKTSSGKIRRAMSRELYEQGALGRTQRAPWWQLDAARGPRRCRAGMAWRVGRGPYRLGLLGLGRSFSSRRAGAWLTTMILPGVDLRRRAARAWARCALALVGDSRAGRRARTPADRERARSSSPITRVMPIRSCSPRRCRRDSATRPSASWPQRHCSVRCCADSARCSSSGSMRQAASRTPRLSKRMRAPANRW